MTTKKGENLLYEDLSYKIRGACFEIWKEFGNAFKESVVRNALVKKLRDLGLSVEVDKKINIYFEGKKVGVYKPDLIINNLILIELKRKPYLTRQDDQQFWYYLKCTEYKLGFLINFGDRELEIKRRIFDKARATLPRSSAFLSANIRLDNRGFTLLELTVVAAIMIMLLVLVMVNFRAFERDQVLDSEADKLASVLKQAQIFALTGQTFAGTRYSYGVHLAICAPAAVCQYILFRDLDADKLYDPGEEVAGNEYEFIKSIYSSNLTPQSGNELDIIFQPPSAVVYLQAAQTDAQADIVLTSSLSGKQRTVSVVRESGQVNIQ